MSSHPGASRRVKEDGGIAPREPSPAHPNRVSGAYADADLVDEFALDHEGAHPARDIPVAAQSARCVDRKIVIETVRSAATVVPKSLLPRAP